MNNRGAITLFKDIFDTPAPVPASGPTLREKKIECIIDFYYYTGRKTKMSYNNLLTEAGQVFFLSSFTLHDIMQNNHEKLMLIKQEWKDAPVEKLQKHLARKWPYMVW